MTDTRAENQIPSSRGAAGPDPRIVLAVLLAAAILPFLNGLGGDFVFDDEWLVAEHPAVQGSFDLAKVLTAQYWGNVQGALLWRPVTTLSFAVDRAISGSPVWFHLVNILLHAAVTWLWFALIRRLTGRNGLAFIAAMLFAVHPIHTEAVTWIAGRAELLAALFALASIHCAIDPRPARRWIALPLVLLAVGSKESAAAVPPILLFLAWAFRREERAPGYAIGLAAFAPALLYFALRRFVLGTWGGPEPDPMDNPMVGLGLASRLPTVLDAAGRYIAILIWPARLSVDYSTPVLDVVRGLTAYLALGLAGLGLLIYLAIRRPARPEGWGSAFALLSFGLTSNLLVVIGTIFAERLLYLPSAGLLLVATAGGIALRRWVPQRALQALLALLLLACAARTIARNPDYRDALSLYRAGVKAAPESPKMRYNLALELNRKGLHDEALSEAREAIRLNPSSRESREIVATSLDTLGRADEAIRFLTEASMTDPGDRAARRRLIMLLEREGRLEEAFSTAALGMRLDPEEPEWIGRAARISQLTGDFARAVPLWREAVARSRDTVDAPLYLAYCLMRTGDMAGARDAYIETLRRQSDLAAAANGLAWTILETGGAPDEAIRHAEAASAKEPENPSYLDTLARAYLVAGRCGDARRAIGRAIELAPANGSYRARLVEIEARCR